MNPIKSITNFETVQLTLSLVGTFVVSMVGLLRFGMMQHRRLADQFVHFLEGMTNRMMTTLDGLANNIHEHSFLLRSIDQRIGNKNQAQIASQSIASQNIDSRGANAI
ncbi:MAG: hypothetical protein ACOVR6_12965 [Fimbriimonas sp.]|jgi:hypothetical protein|nr:hypothetical protein [Fimbriimonadaceae bacterium]MCE2767600.1 hypothetical protein [Fimbriimonadaceae bacterium]